MILATILAIIVAVIAILLAIVVFGLGAGFVVLFGDLIVFVLLVRTAIKFLKKRRKG